MVGGRGDALLFSLNHAVACRYITKEERWPSEGREGNRNGAGDCRSLHGAGSGRYLAKGEGKELALPGPELPCLFDTRVATERVKKRRGLLRQCPLWVVVSMDQCNTWMV